MSEEQNPSVDYKRMSLDKIIEAMTADLENSATRYGQFSVPSQQQTQARNWTDFTPSQLQHFTNHQPINSVPLQPLYMPDMPSYESNPLANSPENIYFPSQRINHLGINENNDLIGTINVGGGNFINVIYGNANQLLTEPRTCNNVTSYTDQTVRDKEYGLFNQSLEVIKYFF